MVCWYGLLELVLHHSSSHCHFLNHPEEGIIDWYDLTINLYSLLIGLGVCVGGDLSPVGSCVNPRILNRLCTVCRIGVDEWLHVPSVPDVFAVGDCCGFLESTGKEVLPALAQVISRTILTQFKSMKAFCQVNISGKKWGLCIVSSFLKCNRAGWNRNIA